MFTWLDNLLSRIFTDKCRYYRTCQNYQEGNFNCEHQESEDSVVCGIWRNWGMK